MFNALPIPPMSEFSGPFYRSAEQAIKTINIHIQPQGFTVSKQSSKPTQILLQYTRSKAYIAKKTTNRQLTTRLTQYLYRTTLYLHPDPKLRSLSSRS